MRISDWSSDVCSSDLPRRRRSCRSQPWPCAPVRPNSTSMTRWRCIRQWQKNLFCSGDQDGNSRSEASDRTAGAPEDSAKSQGDGSRGAFARPILLSLICACLVGLAILVGQMVVDTRSEEQTSELQSLMRLSYAVFCLK